MYTNSSVHNMIHKGINMTILTIKQARATIKLVASAGKKLDERIHTVAVSGLYHFFNSGDLDILSDLVLAMPKSGRGNAFKNWVTKHAAVKWVEKARNNAGGWKKNGDIPEDWASIVDTAEAEPFWLKEDTEAPVFNPKQYASNVRKKLEKEGVSMSDFIAELSGINVPAPAVVPVEVSH